METLWAHLGMRIGAQSIGHISHVNGRLFAWLIGLRDAKFVVGYSSPELDLAMLRGEVDARTNNADDVVRRNPDWVEKGLVDFQVIFKAPKEDKNPRFDHLPELETFAKTERERRILAMSRTMRVAGVPYILPPNTPKDPADTLREAMRKTFRDPDFHREFRRLAGDQPTPLMPEEQEKAIRALPREPALVELFKQIAGSGPLPPR